MPMLTASRRITVPGLVLFALIVLSVLSLRGPPNARLLSHTPSFSSSPPENEPDYWTWDTVSRFRPSPSGAPAKDACAAFPTELLSRVQVVLKIGASEPRDRIETQLATVTRCISNLIIVSDRDEQIQSHHAHDVIGSLPVSYHINNTDFDAYETLSRNTQQSKIDGAQGWRLDRFKFLPMVERAYEINPSAKWFVFLESDTFLFWDNLFRLLDHYNPDAPVYMGSPSPGSRDKDETTWFAYGGAGFVISTAAVQKLVHRESGPYGEYTSPSLSERYEDMVRGDCCGDSVLGWALYQAGVKLTGLWPMFNPHALHGIPFDDAYWCQPVITLHKSLLKDLEGLSEFALKWNRKEPILYSDLLDYLQLGTFSQRTEWDNGDWGGWQEPDSPGHASMEACKAACHDHPTCLQYTYDSSGHCVFVGTVRLGGAKKALPDGSRLSSGWDVQKIAAWRKARECEKPLWMKPSITRIF
ncbi:hypothetical protein ASPWEDRAFT_37949 [Aspergillus wentii DTO 134E9]|uniref:N-acetylgalactosaminide beta-1,3-galactosyltransferase n=1 Tax=Aspergillus wentii DTO 134E9 TaxID=1073089 RepID=A0A1L9RNB4_ASPWE|nr:uncharacterized protein ASPWEDRAFT_37949 [Aspergillus wentii DTO 134E9]OJJ36383.1 hypothetical protein ASPWEDRAFT_37949 [Aspergillus wentii DTO 134E9]